MSVFNYTLEELEDELEELEGLKVEAQKDLDKVLSPDYDPEFDYENEEEKQNLINLDIECERENLAGIEKDIRIITARIERKRKKVNNEQPSTSTN